METILELIKLDLGIAHNKRDVYFVYLITAAIKELGHKGIDIDTSNQDDIMLTVDYCLWRYRKRMENIPLAENIQRRIRERKIRGRIGADV